MTRHTNKKIALIIPCYNEEKRLKTPVYNKFISLNEKEIDFYFVDDGSTDGSVSVIKNEIISKNPLNSFIMQLKKNLGKGTAVRLGLFEAQKYNYDYYAFIDSDLQIPLDQVWRLHQILRKEGALVGLSVRNRLRDYRSNKARFFLSVSFSKLVNYILKLKPRLLDTQCGCKIFKEEIINLGFNQPFISGWLFDLEVLMRLRNSVPSFRNKIVEVKLVQLNKSNNSKLRWTNNIELFRELYRINKKYN